MTPRIRRLAAGLLLPAFAAVAAPLPAPVKHDPPGLITVIDRATHQADIPTLVKLYQNPPDDAARALAAMALERIHFNLAASSRIAAICEKDLIDRRPRIALYCARYAVGNTAIADGALAGARAEARMIARLKDRIPAAELAHMRRYVHTHVDQPPFTVDRPAHGFRIPLQARRGRGRLELQVSAHGRQAMLQVDTGSSYLNLGPRLARRLGVRMLDREHRVNGFISRGISTRLGVIDTLRIGDVVAHNVPVQVHEGDHHLIGIEVLRRLGAFRLSKHAITVYGADQAPPPCRQPLLVASNTWGPDVRVVKAISIAGALRTTLLDSGSGFYLSGDAAALASLKSYNNHRLRVRDLGTGVHHTRINVTQTQVILGGQPFLLTFGIFKDTTLPWHYILGNAALDDMDFLFDFRQRHACLLPHANLH